MGDDETKPSLLAAFVRRRKALVLFLGALAIWLVVMAAFQGGGSALFGLLKLYLMCVLVAGCALGVASQFRERLPFGLMAVMFLGFILWVVVTKSYRSITNLGWDFAAIGLGGFVGAFVFKPLIGFLQRSRLPARLTSGLEDFFPVAVILSGWISLSIMTVLRYDTLPRDVNRFASIGSHNSLVPEQVEQWRDLRIGIALSGGGYRAAVFHAGVLHALEKLGLKPSVLSTVSGGSIIGAYYSIGGDPVAFKDAVAGNRFNLKRELLLFHNVVRLPFPGTVPVADVELFPWYEYSRRDAQAELLERTLFDDDESWRKPVAGQPTIVIATTDLTFGQQVGFTPNGAVVVWLNHSSESFRDTAWAPAREMSLPERVAVSGGFPLAFPAADTRVKVTPSASTGRGERPLLLADGGIVDNSGFMMLQAVDQVSADDRMKSDVFLVSDAGAIFGVELQLDGLGQVLRAADVSGALTRARTVIDRNKPRVEISAQNHFLPPDLQFRMYSGEENQFAGEAGIHFTFDPALGYPKAVVEEIVRLLPESSRERGNAALARYFKVARLSAENRQAWRRALSRQGRKGPCVPDASFPGLCDAYELRSLLRLSIADQLAEFRAASTLDDSPPPDRVEALFALGQLLVYLRWPELQEAMDTAAMQKAAGPQVSASR